MLGSAIPRRWAFSLALVGLISILVVTYTALGADPAFAADSSGTAPGSGTATSLPVADTLKDATIPQGLSLLPGDERVISVQLTSKANVVNNNLPDITYSWGIASGSGITIVGANTSRSVIIQASSSGTAVLEVQVTQGTTTLAVANYLIRQTTVTVNTPGATPTPTVAPTNPGPVPSSIPNSKAVVAPESSSLVTKAGAQSGSNPQTSGLNGGPVIFIQKGSVNNFFGVSLVDVDVNTLPTLPPGVTTGSSAVDIKFVDANGGALATMRLNRAAQICLPAMPGDLVAGYQSVAIYRYNSVAQQWVMLNTTYNALTKQFCANSSNFSTFAIGISQVVPTATPSGSGNLPVTGGWTPTPGMLIFFGLVGLVLVGGGAATMRRARKFGSQ